MTGLLCVKKFTLQSQKHLVTQGSVTKTGLIPTWLKYSHFFNQNINHTCLASSTLKDTFASTK